MVKCKEENLMAFKALFLAYAPDADKMKHRSSINTGKYQLFSVAVKNRKEAVQICESFIEKEKIDAVLLCPGFTHIDVAELVKIAEGKASVCVARGDGPSSKISQAAKIREKYF